MRPSSQPSWMSAASSTRCAGVPARSADLDQPHRVGRVRRADHEHQVGVGGDRPHRLLPVGRRVADVVGAGRAIAREPLAQRVDDLRRLVDRQRGLHQVRDPFAVAGHAAGPRPPGSAPGRMASGASPSVPSISSWPAWPMSSDRVAVGRRTGAPRRAPWPPAGRSRRSTVSPRRRASVRHRGRHAVRGEHDGGAVGHLVELVDEHRAAVARGRATTWALCTICRRT